MWSTKKWKLQGVGYVTCQKKKCDGLCKQVTWPTKKRKWRAGWGAYIIKSCDLLKKENLMADYAFLGSIF